MDHPYLSSIKICRQVKDKSGLVLEFDAIFELPCHLRLPLELAALDKRSSRPEGS